MAARTVTIEVKMDISNAEGKITTLTGSLKLLGDEVRKTGKSTDDFERLVTKNMGDGETAFTALTRRSKELHAEIDGLKRSFGGATTGTQGKSILGDLTSAQNDLKKIKGFLSNMGDEGIKGGQSYFSKFILSFRSLPEFLSGLVTNPIGIGALTVAVPAIVSAVSAAVASGVGLGVIGAGAFILHNDQRVQDAFAPLADTLKNVFTSAAEPMVQPIVDALGSLDKFVRDEQPAFTGLFSAAAPAIGLITKGIEGLVSRLVPALTKDAEGFTNALKDPGVQTSLKNFADGFANIFQVIGDNPAAINAGFHVIAGTLTFVTHVVSGLTVVSDQLVEALDAASNALGGKGDPWTKLGAEATQQLSSKFNKGDINSKNVTSNAKMAQDIGGGFRTEFIDQLNAAYKKGTISAGAFADANKALGIALAGTSGETAVTTAAIITQTDSMQSLSANGVQPLFDDLMHLDDALNSVSGANENLTKANIAVKQSLADFTKAVDANKKAHDKHALSLNIDTQTGRENVNGILAQIDANKVAYTKQVALEAPIKGTDQALKDANATYQKNTDKVEANSVKLGFNKGKVHDLIVENGKIPPAVSTQYKTPGLADAKDSVAGYKGMLDHIPHNKSTYITTYFLTKGTPHTGPLARGATRWGGLYEHAADGLLSGASVYPPASPGRYMIAEPQTGGEAFIPKYGNPTRSLGILAAAAGWYGAHVVPGYATSNNSGGGIIVNIWASDPQAKAFLAAARYTVQANGGNPVQVFTPR